jgi:nicotinamidase-related amidase
VTAVLDFDPSTSTLVPMDFQNYGLHPDGYWARQGLPEFPSGAYAAVANLARVLTVARAAGLLIVHVRAAWRPGSPEMNMAVPVFARGPDRAPEGTWAADFYQPVAPKVDEIVVTKRGIGAFNGTELDRLLRIRGVNTVILCGIATNWVVEGTAMDAADLGYRVIVPEDCSASVTAEMHQFAIERVLPDIATISTADDIIAYLEAL